MSKIGVRVRLRRWWRRWGGVLLVAIAALILVSTVLFSSEQINTFVHAMTWGSLNQVADYFRSAQVRENVQLSEISWGSVAAIATLFTVVLNAILLASVIFGFKSVQEGQAARSANILIWAISQMDDIKSDERLVRAASSDHLDWDDNVRAAAIRTRNAYQRMSYFARKGLIDKHHFRSLWGINIALYWRVLRGFVFAEREKFGDQTSVEDGAYMAADFEALAEEFHAYYLRTHRGLMEGYIKNARPAQGPKPLDIAPIEPHEPKLTVPPPQ
jgi:hypothetical protein